MKENKQLEFDIEKNHAKTMLIIGICLFIIAGAYFLYNVFYNNKTDIKTKEFEIILKEKDELYRKIYNLQPYCGKISEDNITDIFESNDERKQYIAYYSLSSEFQSYQQLMNFISQIITDEMLQKLKSKNLNTFDEKLYMEKDNKLYCGHVFGGTRPIPDTIYRISKYDENTIVGTATDIYGKEYVDANIVDNNQYEYSITLLKENGLWKIDEYEFKSDNDNTGAYKYLCLNKDMNKNDIIYRNMLVECSRDEELEYGALNEKILDEVGLKLADSYSDLTYYIKDSKKANSILNVEDIYWKLDELTKKEITSQIGVNYLLNIESDKYLYITNKDKNNTAKIFDKEKIKSFYIRPYCCAGGKKILLITESNNVYISDEDIDLYISSPSKKIEDITFKKLDLSNIKEFHINSYVPSMGGTHVYAIDNSGTSYLID